MCVFFKHTQQKHDGTRLLIDFQISEPKCKVLRFYLKWQSVDSHFEPDNNDPTWRKSKCLGTTHREYRDVICDIQIPYIDYTL